MVERSPLQRARERLGLTQEEVADELHRIGLEGGHGELGVDANAVSRHERGVIAMPRPPYPALYAELYGVSVETLWPAARIEEMERRRFLRAMAATGVAAMLPPGSDMTTEAITSVTGGFRRLEAGTPVTELRGPVGAHLRFIAGRLERGGAQLAPAASEAAGFAAWLAFDQADDQNAARHYGRAIGYAERSGSDVLAAYMLGSMSAWAAEVGNGRQALDLIGRARSRLPALVPPTVRAWTAAVQATAHASVGDADAALAALKQAEQAAAGAHEPLWPWLFPFDPAKHAAYLGACAARLRLPRTAVPALHDALAGLGPAPTKTRALVLADLAASHRAMGDHEQAVSLADQARAIGEACGSARVARRLLAAA
jgi:transcriptional regulator with XRE-family HTH domain